MPRIRPRMFRPSTVKEFIDRAEERLDFWNIFTTMINEDVKIINFYGPGGVGKSALLRRLEEEILRQGSNYIKYDFSIGTDVRDVLKTFRAQLTNYGCNFPLFDIGNYYYSLNIGQDVKAPRQPTAFEQLPWVQSLRRQLSQAGNVGGNARTVFDTAKKFFKSTTEPNSDHWLNNFLEATIGGLNTSLPMMRTITILMSVADMFLERYMRDKNILDENHQFIRNELNDRRQKKDSVALYEYLPTLFAMDVSDWIGATGNKLVVFLDNYESLAGTTNFMAPEQRKRDLWLRGDYGLVYNIPNILWTIAGRNKLTWEGELAAVLEDHQHQIFALKDEHSEAFLAKAGIANEKLRNGLVELTNGYPIFLDLCVDVYVEYKRQHNNEPPLEEFGQKREDVVGRIFRYLYAEHDYAAIDMLTVLCILGTWTDEIVYGINESKTDAALFNFSPSTYKRVKEFSFIKREKFKNEDSKLQIYRFDKTIQNLLVAMREEIFVSKVKKAVNNYFQKFFAEQKYIGVKESFYLKLWAEFIIRFATDATELLTQYKDLLSAQILTLTNSAHFDAVEGVLMMFMNKLENLGSNDTLPYAHFEMDLGRLRRAQGKYSEAYAITNSVYEKHSRLLGEENSETVEAMHRLAISLNDLGRYEEAIKFHRHVLDLRQKTLGEENLKTVEAMHCLATSLNNFGKYKEAFELLEKVLALRKKLCGEEDPETLNSMNNLAVSLSSLAHYDEAFKIRENVWKLNKKIHGEEHLDTILAMNNLSLSLSSLKRYNEALTYQKKVLALRKKFLGEEHPDTIAAMINLAGTFSSLNRYPEALALHRRAFRLYDNILGKKHPYTLIAMDNLALTLNNLERHEEARELQEELVRRSKKFFGDEYANTITYKNNLARSLSLLEHYEEAALLQEQVLKSCQNIYDDEHPYVIIAMRNLALTLTILKRYDEALPLYEQILSVHRNNLGEEHPATLADAEAVAQILHKLGRND